MAHFWNESNGNERLTHFHYFLELVGGGGGRNEEISERYTAMGLRPELMPDMPMANYIDLPIELIPAWKYYFCSTLETSTERTALLKKMYEALTDAEQGLVIQDLGVFINLAIANAGGPAAATAAAAALAGSAAAAAAANDGLSDDSGSRKLLTTDNTTSGSSADNTIAVAHAVQVGIEAPAEGEVSSSISTSKAAAAVASEAADEAEVAKAMKKWKHEFGTNK